MPNEQGSEQRRHRILSKANVVAFISGFVTFILLIVVWNSNLGIVVSGVVAGIITGLVWLGIVNFRSPQSLRSVLDGYRLLGAIPSDESGPAPALGSGDTADRYTGLLTEVEARTRGRVVLVSSPTPGQGSSTVSLNLAIAAARAGRRVMLIDADASANGIGQFLSSGSTPGLSEVASGAATLVEATRMWTLDDGTKFPVLPSGARTTNVDELSGLLVADALDTVSEHADLILIDVPPVLWSDATPELGKHADGTILVLSDTADPQVVKDAIDKLDACGAPALGYVRNRSRGTARLAPSRLRSSLVRVAAMAFALLFAYAIFTSFTLWNSWRSVETEAFTPDVIAQIDAQPTTTLVGPGASGGTVDEETATEFNSPGTTAPEEAYQTFLLVGGDRVSGAADVILYLVLPTNGADPFMVSLPRDLFVDNLCTGGQSRINALIHGCESKGINGPSLLAYEVGQFTGIEVDHFALFDFDGFEDIIDAVGGVEICLDYPVRDEKAELALPAGCTSASGEQALSWVRSRKTQQKINGSWKSVPGASDLSRNQNQQDVIIQLFQKLKEFDSPTDLTASVASLADTFILDDQLGLADVVNLAWDIRGIDLETVNRLRIPAKLGRSNKGQSILIATASFDQVLADAYGGSLPSEDASAEEASLQSE
ncbi:MAG: hypothetical protein BMS9Abin12_2368 [Acidimicrobiia bacterium]|nr:MAG: hypothetical protein BMS9Abin12_2368 [Acidimicrobiia bacterium]